MKTIKASNVERLQFLGNRIIAQALKVAAGILPVRDPKLLVGTSAIQELAACIAGYGSAESPAGHYRWNRSTRPIRRTRACPGATGYNPRDFRRHYP